MWNISDSGLQIYDNKKHIATAHYAGNPCVDVKEALDNARLIAAAPELLDALENLAIAAARIVEDDNKPTMEHMRELNRRRQNAIAAIAKATGE